MQLILKLSFGLAALYAVVALSAFFFQRRLTYFPDPERTAPASFNLPRVEERIIETDGERLVSWFAPASPGRPTILYFHGNAGNLASRSERVRRFLARGWGVLFMSYRGYSGSSGSPSERANVADAKRAYEMLRREGVPPEDIIVYGESLGSGVAVQVAAEKGIAGLVLDAPYTSIVDVAAVSYPYLPVRPFILDRYETMRYLTESNGAAARHARRRGRRHTRRHGQGGLCCRQRAKGNRHLPARRALRPSPLWLVR